jgi:oxaloacetate decarboxylase alpha subunit
MASQQLEIVDTTLRDGSQSLWGLGMRSDMIEAVAPFIDQAGFQFAEVPLGALYFKKFVRDHKEDPWEMSRMIARTMPNARKAWMTPGGFIHPFDAPPPKEIVELFYTRLVEAAGLARSQTACNTSGQMETTFPWLIPLYKNLGLHVALGLSYTISPRHTDEYYAAKTREVLRFRPDSIYVKDQGGLLTVDRVRTLVPAILANAGDTPVELHSHCTTGLAPLVYLEALKLGIRILHTAIPPLANGSSQPSIFNVEGNARDLGFSTRLDARALQAASGRLMEGAKANKLPIGAPIEYEHRQYVHQVPGGVISNLKHQLSEMRMLERLPEVLEESVRVRRDLGYPIMITPHSQFMVTQSAINVATGERYKHVIDELILFAQGVFGEDSGYLQMDPNLRDRLLGTPRANELRALRERPVTLREIRDKLGGAGVSDEEFLLRYIMKGEEEIKAMRAARSRAAGSLRTPLAALIEELGKHRSVRYVKLERPEGSLVAQRRRAA